MAYLRTRRPRGRPPLSFAAPQPFVAFPQATDSFLSVCVADCASSLRRLRHLLGVGVRWSVCYFFLCVVVAVVAFRASEPFGVLCVLMFGSAFYTHGCVSYRICCQRCAEERNLGGSPLTNVANVFGTLRMGSLFGRGQRGKKCAQRHNYDRFSGENPEPLGRVGRRPASPCEGRRPATTSRRSAACRPPPAVDKLTRFDSI